MRQFINQKEKERIDPIPYEIIRPTMPHTRLSIDENRLLNSITDWVFGNEYRNYLVKDFNLFSWAQDKLFPSDVLKAVTESVGEDNLAQFDDD